MVRTAVLAALLAVGGAAALAACGRSTASGSAFSAAGSAWTIQSVTTAAGPAGEQTRAAPATAAGRFVFGSGGHLTAYDGVNTANGTFSLVAGGFRTSAMAATLVGYAGSDPAVELQILAVAAVDGGDPVAATVAGNQLTLAVGDYRIRCARAPLTEPPVSAPSSSK